MLTDSTDTDEKRITPMAMDNTNTDREKDGETKNLLYGGLTYKIRRAFFNVYNNYGPAQKERIYHEALKDELHGFGLPFIHEGPLEIFSLRDGREIGTFIPDFVIDGKVIVEVKSVEFLPKKFEEQLMRYLRNTKYEIGFLVNFGGEELDVRRKIFTNDRKPRLLTNG